jgi:DNA polymerase III epsilon subunit-like protein
MITLIFDTETTGLVKHPLAKDSIQPQIIEWAGILVDENAEVIQELELLINPGCPLPQEITKITGLTDEDLADKPSFKEVARLIQNMFEMADALLAHNLPFDSNMMKLELRRLGLLESWPWPRLNICTVQEHAEEWGYRPKLKELYEWYTGQPLDQKHRALDDVRTLAIVAKQSGVLP